MRRVSIAFGMSSEFCILKFGIPVCLTLKREPYLAFPPPKITATVIAPRWRKTIWGIKRYMAALGSDILCYIVMTTRRPLSMWIPGFGAWPIGRQAYWPGTQYCGCQQRNLTRYSSAHSP